MTTYRRNNASRGGFTLVELLVVIVIIGLLAGLTTTVVVGSRHSVRAAVVSTMEAQLSIALDEYKNRYGEYPPDFSDQVAVERHLKKRWPRYEVTYAEFLEDVDLGCRLSSGGYARNPSNLPASGLAKDLVGFHVWNIREHISAILFWLGGLPDENGVPSGFYASPKYPLGIVRTNNITYISRPDRAKREKPLFLCDRKDIGAFGYVNEGSVSVFSRLDGTTLDSGTTTEYIPGYCQGDLPIVYFSPSPNAPYGTKSIRVNLNDQTSDAVPYAKGLSADGASVDWYEANRFQLIHPGVDGLFGESIYGNSIDDVRFLQPKSTTVSVADDDNVTNFLTRGTLVSEYKD